VASRELLFVQVDVFTERVFGGNPLAVVFEAAGLSDLELQALGKRRTRATAVLRRPMP